MTRLHKIKRYPHAVYFKRSRAAFYLYLLAEKEPARDIFRYFFDLEMTPPRKIIRVDELADIIKRSHATAVKEVRTIQKEYNRLPANFITIKDFCRYHKIDEGCIQKYYYSLAIQQFVKRESNLKRKK